MAKLDPRRPVNCPRREREICLGSTKKLPPPELLDDIVTNDLQDVVAALRIAICRCCQPPITEPSPSQDAFTGCERDRGRGGGVDLAFGSGDRGEGQRVIGDKGVMKAFGCGGDGSGADGDSFPES
ncbi:hypothetical protein Acr_02g0002230 [Actinidia rufa]|uniref:Uncharacterized protein n=1 Tax=Actinidia rufa TaxID=165716 RepID=A0A7J0E652_9ERIC|nr:hypothetical protein Acr_02g0002230 [Actinidia rufa]